ELEQIERLLSRPPACCHNGYSPVDPHDVEYAGYRACPGIVDPRHVTAADRGNTHRSVDHPGQHEIHRVWCTAVCLDRCVFAWGTGADQPKSRACLEHRLRGRCLPC